MDYQEIQSFRDARVDSGLELLRSEIASLEAQNTELDNSDSLRRRDIRDLEEQLASLEKSERQMPGTNRTYYMDTQRLNERLHSLKQRLSSSASTKRLHEEQLEILGELLAERASEFGESVSGYESTPPAFATTPSTPRPQMRAAMPSPTSGTTTDIVRPTPAVSSQSQPTPQSAATGIQPGVRAQASQTTVAASSQNPSVAAAGSLLSQRLKTRLAVQSVRQSRREGESAGDEVEKARKVTRPSKFAYITIGLMGLSFDVLNWLVSVLVVVDLVLAVVFFLSIRAMINRPVKTQQLFAVFLVLFICFLFIPIVGPIFAFPLLAIVLIAGVWNPNAKYSSFDRERLQGALDDFRGSVNKIQNLGKKAQAAKGAASKAKSLSTVTSKAPKTTLRLGASAGAEAIPFISWLPLNIMNAVWTFTDMRKGYAEAQRLVAQYEQQQKEAADAERAAIRAEEIANMENILRSSVSRQLDTKPQAGDNGLRRSEPATAGPAQQAPVPAPRPVVRDIGPAAAPQRPTPVTAGARA